jgi:hypothetical protein
MKCLRVSDWPVCPPVSYKNPNSILETFNLAVEGQVIVASSSHSLRKILFYLVESVLCMDGFFLTIQLLNGGLFVLETCISQSISQKLLLSDETECAYLMIIL